MTDRLAELCTGDDQTRTRCAEELGDALEYGDVSGANAEQIVGSLIEAICREKNARMLKCAKR